MRITLSMDEYFKLVEALHKHKEVELTELIKERFKKSFPTKEGLENKQNAAKKARDQVKNRNNEKIDIVLESLIRRKEDITVTNVAKEANIAYNTANKYKVRIKLIASEEKAKRESSNIYH